MNENLESRAPRDRPRMMPAWPRGAPYLREWRTGRWFVVLLVPIGARVGAIITRGLPWSAPIVFAAIGAVVAFLLFATIASGVDSSNTGTYFRKRESVRFWMGVAILAACYTVVATA